MEPPLVVSARVPAPELVGVAYGPNVVDPATREAEREDRHDDAVLLGYQAGLAVDRVLEERHAAGWPAGQPDEVARDLLGAIDGVQRGADKAATIGGQRGAGV